VLISVAGPFLLIKANLGLKEMESFLLRIRKEGIVLRN